MHVVSNEKSKETSIRENVDYKYTSSATMGAMKSTTLSSKEKDKTKRTNISSSQYTIKRQLGLQSLYNETFFPIPRFMSCP